ncbi:chemotaxis protein CheW [Bacillus sp. LL01]|uniref:chemotaxis protein CheW n=1 Tax=Bacillus sp. LL01 TaxID=1665556 RepID=UPI00064D5211|nr:chemotaxis protein CheW [Bacillus sp. LL01]KMJ59951.1 chemotaxis protein CheW [Bacillus sp. LL01]
MESQKLVIFEVNGEEYGISVEYVVSIEKLATVTALPEMETYLKGLMKVRGELIPLLDTKQILFSGTTEATDKARVIMVQCSELSVGLLVEDAKEILDVPQESIKSLNLFGSQTTTYIHGMINLENRLIAILDPSSLLNSLNGMESIKEAVEKQEVKN